MQTAKKVFYGDNENKNIANFIKTCLGNKRKSELDINIPEFISPITRSTEFAKRWTDVWNYQSYNEFIDDWLQTIKERRSLLHGRKYVSFRLPYSTLDYCTVEVIFSICKELNQPAESRYLTLELFDRFTTCYYKEVTRAFCINRQSEVTEWNSIISQVRSQTLLRVMSCVQLASKYSSHSAIVSTKKAYNYLISVEKPFTKKTILSSERRVFECLDFKVNVFTLLTYVDALLHLVRTMTNKDFYEVCIGIIDAFYLQHNEIFYKLQETLLNFKSSSQAKKNFMDIKCDGLFAGAAVVLTAIKIHYVNEDCTKSTICRSISNFVEWPLSDILTLSNIIFQTIYQ